MTNEAESRRNRTQRPPPHHGWILRHKELEPHGETGKRWKKGDRGESTQYAKKANRRGRVKYAPTKRNHATREVKGCDTYLDRRRKAEVTPWKP